MGIAISLQQYLDSQGVPYEVMTHERTVRSTDTAKASSIHGNNLAKGVLMKSGEGYILAVVPASRHVRLDALEHWVNQPAALATEAEISRIFSDCELGSIPPVAAAYGIAAVMDDCFDSYDDIYFEGGDHRSLLHLKGSEFRKLMAGVPHAPISARNH
jgi:Ala-tRNA(Pro) deacylase